MYNQISFKHITFGLFFFLTFDAFSQKVIIRGKDVDLGGNYKDQLSPVQTAVPFLSIAPNARAAALGDQGVATSADEYSAYWNPGKMAFLEKDYGGSVSHNPWLRSIVPDMALNYVTFYYKPRDFDAIGLNFTYFDLGSIEWTDQFGGSLGTGRPQELSLSGSYSRKLSKKLSAGLSIKYIYSNLNQGLNDASGQTRPGQTAAADIGFYYNTDMFAFEKDMHLAIGIMVGNVGGKINYGNNSRADFIPTIMRLGVVHSTELDPYNKINIGIEASKLLTPSSIYDGTFYKKKGTDEDSTALIESTVRLTSANKSLLPGMFGSFSDAPGGAKEEFQEVMLSFSAEYWYDNMFAVRGGYFYENPLKGNRQYFAVGFGIRYNVFALDFAYTLPVIRNNPLANTLRVSLALNFERPKEKDVVPE